MSYNKKDHMDMDELNIKSHLNASLELDGINVSEELIRRTLKAINQQSGEEMKTTNVERKSSHWHRYVRSFAGVAAAIVVVILGYSVAKNMPMGAKKDASPDNHYMTSEVAKDSADPEKAETDLSDAIQDGKDITEYNAFTENTTTAGSSDERGDINYTISGTQKANSEETYGSDPGATGDDSNGASDKDTSGAIEAPLKAGLTGRQIFSFRDICILTPDQLKEVRITDNSRNLTKTITDQAQIQDIYTRLGDYTFSIAPETSTDRYYSVEIDSTTQEENFYAILIGENITVQYQQGDDVVESIYNSTDYENFMIELDLIFNDISE